MNFYLQSVPINFYWQSVPIFVLPICPQIYFLLATCPVGNYGYQLSYHIYVSLVGNNGYQHKCEPKALLAWTFLTYGATLLYPVPMDTTCGRYDFLSVAERFYLVAAQC